MSAAPHSYTSLLNTCLQTSAAAQAGSQPELASEVTSVHS